jgi:hypothetical protein
MRKASMVAPDGLKEGNARRCNEQLIVAAGDVDGYW